VPRDRGRPRAHGRRLGRTLAELSADELRAASPELEPGEVAALLEQDSWLESKVSEGGTALARVREQLGLARGLLGS
jgi:argininosuccinate lyase